MNIVEHAGCYAAVGIAALGVAVVMCVPFLQQFVSRLEFIRTILVSPFHIVVAVVCGAKASVEGDFNLSVFFAVLGAQLAVLLLMENVLHWEAEPESSDADLKETK